MKKTILLSVALIFACFSAFAQEGNNQASIGLDLGLPTGDFGKSSNVGFGGTVKGMYGIGTAGQVELTLGYIGFGGKSVDFGGFHSKSSVGIIPILIGYRHHIEDFYLEPQLGLSVFSSKMKSSGSIGGMTIPSSSSSTTGFGWALGAGYLYQDFDFSIRYQSQSAGGGSIGFFGVRVGYNFDIDLSGL